MARWLEFVLATLLLVLLSGLLLVCGVVVALTSIGPVIFRQRRIGRGGRLFTLLKFRTMHHNAEGISLTLNDDPRITRVGAWLRRTHLDELPQLMNILVGHMSFVGPRPEVPEFVDVCEVVPSGELERRQRGLERRLEGTACQRTLRRDPCTLVQGSSGSAGSVLERVVDRAPRPAALRPRPRSMRRRGAPSDPAESSGRARRWAARTSRSGSPARGPPAAI